MSKTDKTLLWMVLGLLGMALCLGLGAVWLNIERMDLAYDLRKMEQSLGRKEDLAAKLTVERNNLVSPYRLKSSRADSAWEWRRRARYGALPRNSDAH